MASAPAAQSIEGPAPIFRPRERCIACASEALDTLSGGTYADQPLNGFISNDPWGESPLATIEGETWELVRCRQCAQMFHKWILTPEWMETLFTRWMSGDAIREFERRHGIDAPDRVFEGTRAAIRHLLRLEKMTRSLRGGAALRVMDFGCGWGKFLAGAALFGVEAFGIDRDQDRREGAELLGVRVLPGLDDLDPSLRRTFHAITSFQVMEHLEDPLGVLRQLADWIVTDGVLILETPNCAGVTGFGTQADYRAINPLSHINAFTPESLAALARRAGFEPVAPAAAHATADPVSVVKTELKRVGHRLLRPTTDLYFRRR